jgi:DNA phosphorothioation-dependent restriction protein DptH
MTLVSLPQRRAMQALLDAATPRLIRIHAVANEVVQRAYASFVLYRVYQDMFRRGRQEWLTHAVLFDEAHRASRLKLLPTMAKECRKYGLALIVASQEARDFDAGLFAAIANYLVLRVTDADARAMAKNVASSEQERRIADRLKNLQKFEALFFTEGQRQPALLRLESPE